MDIGVLLKSLTGQTLFVTIFGFLSDDFFFFLNQLKVKKTRYIQVPVILSVSSIQFYSIQKPLSEFLVLSKYQLSEDTNLNNCRNFIIRRSLLSKVTKNIPELSSLT